MLFSSLVFIWYFLPIVFFAYMCIPGIRAKNLLLLAASILFYAWGEPKFVLLMLLSVLLSLLVMLAIAVGTIVVAVLQLVYLYRTAKLFRQHCPAALPEHLE